MVRCSLALAFKNIDLNKLSLLFVERQAGNIQELVIFFSQKTNLFMKSFFVCFSPFFHREDELLKRLTTEKGRQR